MLGFYHTTRLDFVISPEMVTCAPHLKKFLCTSRMQDGVSVYLSVYQSISLSVCLSVELSFCRFVTSFLFSSRDHVPVCVQIQYKESGTEGK